MDMMISSASSTAASADAHHDNHQHQQDPIGTAAASLQTEEGRNAKQARQAAASGSGGERKPRPAQDHALKCPRCESTNTKFCYYNNYNMLQPRYFCKACRRYWTQGGSLRDVPVGGRCRKSKRSSGSSSSSSASSLPSSSSSSIKMNNQQLVPGQPMVPVSTDFPNVLPTFMSTGFELPSDYMLFAPLSLSSPPPALATGSGTTASFLDIMGGGFLDGDHQSSSFYGPTTNGMAIPLPPLFGLGVMHHQHGPNNGDVARSAGLLQVGDDGAHQQQLGLANNNDVMMESNNGGGTSRDCNWKNSNGAGVPGSTSSASPATATINNNLWQAGAGAGAGAEGLI